CSISGSKPASQARIRIVESAIVVALGGCDWALEPRCGVRLVRPPGGGQFRAQPLDELETRNAASAPTVLVLPDIDRAGSLTIRDSVRLGQNPTDRNHEFLHLAQHLDLMRVAGPPGG